MVALVPLPASLLLLLIALFRTIHHLQHDFGLRRTADCKLRACTGVHHHHHLLGLLGGHYLFHSTLCS
uniref:Putative secreted protein n=1 Tax=Anopheles darlingi TaxID=43151 RepID=A0A2M4DI80_ANODA